MAGGKDGIVIAPRDPDGSLLLQKVTLPPTDPHFMPAEGRTPLTRDEIARIRAWVLAGAPPDLASVPGIFIAEDHDEAPTPVGDYSALMGEIRQMQQSQGAKLVPVSANASDGLILRTTDVAGSAKTSLRQESLEALGRWARVKRRPDRGREDVVPFQPPS